jgi:hypothetical protein
MSKLTLARPSPLQLCTRSLDLAPKIAHSRPKVCSGKEGPRRKQAETVALGRSEASEAARADADRPLPLGWIKLRVRRAWQLRGRLRLIRTMTHLMPI